MVIFANAGFIAEDATTKVLSIDKLTDLPREEIRKANYVQVEENLIVKSAFDDSIFNNDDYFFPIRYRMTVSEYLRAHEIRHDLDRYRHVPIRSKEASEYMYRLHS